MIQRDRKIDFKGVLQRLFDVRSILGRFGRGLFELAANDLTLENGPLDISSFNLLPQESVLDLLCRVTEQGTQEEGHGDDDEHHQD